MTNGIEHFVLARIADDEAMARKVLDGDSINDLVPAEYFRARGLMFPIDRVLAECDAKRRIVQWHHRVPLPYERHQLMRMLALPYATHPDYDEEWRP